MLNIPGSVFAPTVLPAFADLGLSIVEANAQQRGEERRQRREDRARALMKSDERERLDRARARATVMAQQLGLPDAGYEDPNDVASIAGIQNTRTGLAQGSAEGRASAAAAMAPVQRQAEMDLFDAMDYRKRASRRLEQEDATRLATKTESERRALELLRNEEENAALQDAGILDVNMGVPDSRTNWGPVVPQRLPGVISPRVALGRQDQAELERHRRATEAAAMLRADGGAHSPAEKQFEAAMKAYVGTDVGSMMDSFQKGKTFPTAAQIAARRVELRNAFGLPPEAGAPVAPTAGADVRPVKTYTQAEVIAAASRAGKTPEALEAEMLASKKYKYVKAQ